MDERMNESESIVEKIWCRLTGKLRKRCVRRMAWTILATYVVSREKQKCRLFLQCLVFSL